MDATEEAMREVWVVATRPGGEAERARQRGERVRSGSPGQAPRAQSKLLPLNVTPDGRLPIEL